MREVLDLLGVDHRAMLMVTDEDLTRKQGQAAVPSDFVADFAGDVVVAGLDVFSPDFDGAESADELPDPPEGEVTLVESAPLLESPVLAESLCEPLREELPESRREPLRASLRESLR